MELTFSFYTGDTGDLRTSKNHLNFKWKHNDCNVLFSVTQQGEAAVCHFTSDKPGLRYLRKAIDDWCKFCFYLLEECEMIIGVIERISVFKLAIDCGFQHIASFGNKQVCIRRRQWVV